MTTVTYDVFLRLGIGAFALRESKNRKWRPLFHTGAKKQPMPLT